AIRRTLALLRAHRLAVLRLAARGHPRVARRARRLRPKPPPVPRSLREPPARSGHRRELARDRALEPTHLAHRISPHEPRERLLVRVAVAVHLEPLLEPLADLRRVLEAPIGILLQALHHDRHELAIDLPSELAQ